MVTPSIFDDLFSRTNNLKTLPLTHKNSWDKAKKVISDKMITPKKCAVFSKDDKEENLIYLFYGRGSFRVSDEIKSPDESYFPICFILDADTVHINNVFPFDSGAFAYNRYEEFINKETDINSFLLNPHIDYIKVFIEYFYGNNCNYYNVSPNCSNVDFDNISPELQSYIKMLNAGINKNFDKRGSTIEVLSKIPVDLTKSLKAIIVPLDLKRGDKDIKDMEGKYGIEIIPYPTPGNYPSDYNGVICDKLYEYLKRERII